MKLISSREASNFLSQAAPRPWVQRLLRWMAFDQELAAYSSKGHVTAHTDVFSITSHLFERAGEFSGPKMDAIIREEYAADFAEKLVGRERNDLVYDEPVVWNDSKEPQKIDPGFFLYASEIDWNEGVMTVDWFSVSSGFHEAIFVSDSLFESDFENPSFEAELCGISFEFSAIELLLPNIELRQASGFVTEAPERRRAIGRPPKWNWEGALAFVISQAQLPDGLPTGPGAQARIEEMIASWFMEESGETPAPSQVRQRAATIMKTLEKPTMIKSE